MFAIFHDRHRSEPRRSGKFLSLKGQFLLLFCLVHLLSSMTCLHQFPTIPLPCTRVALTTSVVEQSECKTYFPNLRDALVSYGSAGPSACHAWTSSRSRPRVAPARGASPVHDPRPVATPAPSARPGSRSGFWARSSPVARLGSDRGRRKVGMATVYGQSTRDLRPGRGSGGARPAQALIQSAVRANHVPST